MKIKEYRFWDVYNVRAMCIKHNFYTNGSNEEYTKMLEYVSKHKPSNTSLYRVAKDIFEHSVLDCEYIIGDIMSIMMEEVVRVGFVVEE